VRRILVLGVCVLALTAAAARGGGPAAPLPLPCGLPPVQPLWVDYADGGVPFWSTIFARPGIVGAASNLLIPPQLRAKGAQTVYFDLYLNNRVGTPSKPADPTTIQARADKLFDTAVASSGCDHPLIAENELFGAQTPTPWTATTAQYRANVLAYLQRLADRGARPYLLLSNKPYTHDEVADGWWRQVAGVSDLVAEVLTFSSTPHAGGREGLQPLSKWLDVVKWESLAAKQVAAELQIASIWSWGWAAFNPAGNDPDKPTAACTWLWTRDHSLCDAPALAGKTLDQSLEVGAALPAGTICLLGTTRLLARDVAALTRLTGDRDLAFSAELQHAVLVEARAVDPTALARAEHDVVADRFGGSGPAYAAALAKARVTRALAREILADELRRRSVEATLRVPAPAVSQLRAWYETYGATSARSVRVSRPVAWLGNARAGVALAAGAPGRLFALPSGASALVDGVRITALGEAAPLGSFPYTQAAPAIRRALLGQQKHAAFATWARRRENQSLGRLSCRHDQAPQPATVDLTGFAPFLSLG
jgi:hypothetical protein